MSDNLSVLGLDVSLTATGVALIQPHRAVETSVVTSKGTAKETLVERSRRQYGIVEKLSHTFDRMLPGDLVVIEAPAFAKNVGKQWDRAGLWWAVVQQAWRSSLRVVQVPPTSLKVYAAGKGNAHKDAVIAATVRRYPELNIDDNNVSDAVVLMAMGCRAIEAPIDDIPKANLVGMAGVDWSVLAASDWSEWTIHGKA